MSQENETVNWWDDIEVKNGEVEILPSEDQEEELEESEESESEVEYEDTGEDEYVEDEVVEEPCPEVIEELKPQLPSGELFDLPPLPPKSSLSDLDRPVTESNQHSLFEVEPDWVTEWQGMPEFSMKDCTPQFHININFMTAKDVNDFAKKSGLPVTIKSNSCWFPHQKHLSGGQFQYTGSKTDSRYPICIPSKGRADCQKTGKALDVLGVSYKFFVEETEGDLYKRYLGSERVVVMPFHDLGQGSIPARNFIWEWAKERGFKRHWTVDDNINGFIRTNQNRRLQVKGGGFFQAMEDFVDRYENIAMAGPHHIGFVPDRGNNLTPYLLNSRIYSCILLDTTLPHRWRGRYNEDTDLSLRLLKDGYCTLLFRSLCMQKGDTVGTKSSNPMKGGNTDNVYNSGDFRLAFAESLKAQHPDVVEVVWKFNRWHHQVDYSPFKKNKLIKKPGLVVKQSVDNYGMELVDTKETNP